MTEPNSISSIFRALVLLKRHRRLTVLLNEKTVKRRASLVNCALIPTYHSIELSAEKTVPPFSGCENWNVNSTASNTIWKKFSLLHGVLFSFIHEYIHILFHKTVKSVETQGLLWAVYKIRSTRIKITLLSNLQPSTNDQFMFTYLDSNFANQVSSCNFIGVDFLHLKSHFLGY